jgi:hypothetical protein
MMVEINEKLHKKLAQNYKYHIYHQERALSLGFYTNNEILDSHIHDASYPFIEVKTRDFSALLVAPLPPFTAELSALQKTNFAEIFGVYTKIKESKKMII